ncbi:probable cytochrome P450 6g2 [Onthophagus taurus]|uniref:probable cytochrome P450 6g2 n=1 Tax=Onthophagus taurus TaxID=166361 RepID=UPI0039BEB036
MSLLILSLLLGVIYYFYQKQTLKKWINLNIPGPEPIFPFGNMSKFVTLRSSLTMVFTEIYKKFENCRYVGIFLMNRPGVLIRDPELVEEILVKNFSSFHDNDIHVNKEDDVIFGNNPFVVKGSDWKDIRTQHLLSLTGSKVKNMFPEINEVGDKMVKYLKSELNKTEMYCMDALELMARYTTDVVTSVALGIDAKSFTSEEPKLRNAGKTIFEPNKKNGLKVIALFVMPWLSKVISLRLISKSLENLYKKMIEDVERYREEMNLKRNDFFEHIKEFRGKKMSIENIMTQVGGVYIDGFGTNSSALNFMVYELAKNEDVQQNLRQEIKKYLNDCNGVITFEGVQSLEYLNAVIHESLRKYPPFPQLTKVCTQEYTFPKSTTKSSEFKSEIGLPIVIPVYALQNDEKYFPEPDVFKPERFLPENKEKIIKYTYMPFGDGPRICIGQKFALLQSKIALLKLVSNFNMKLNYDKTKMPVELDPFGVILAAKGRLWINFIKIN